MRTFRDTFALLALALTTLAVSATPRRVTVRPQPTDELLANPGMGWQTFHTFADEDRNLQGLPSGCAYARFYWREIEPADGKIAFPQLDSILQHLTPRQQAQVATTCTKTRSRGQWSPAILRRPTGATCLSHG